MTRPCFLVVDREHSASISTRKLVIESAKFNVLTAYSAEEAVDTLRKFPAVDGIILDAKVQDGRCNELLRSLKKIAPGAPVIVVRLPWSDDCNEADHKVETFEPERLLTLLQRLFPIQAKNIEKRNEELKQQE